MEPISNPDLPWPWSSGGAGSPAPVESRTRGGACRVLRTWPNALGLLGLFLLATGLGVLALRYLLTGGP